MNTPIPLSGFMCTMVRLVGTNRLCTHSPYLTMRTPSMEISTVRRNMLTRRMRKARAKRSLIISSVGRRPRTMRSWLVKS